jgi:hypothetical protein
LYGAASVKLLLIPPILADLPTVVQGIITKIFVGFGKLPAEEAEAALSGTRADLVVTSLRQAVELPPRIAPYKWRAVIPSLVSP